MIATAAASWWVVPSVYSVSKTEPYTRHPRVFAESYNQYVGVPCRAARRRSVLAVDDLTDISLMFLSGRSAKTRRLFEDGISETKANARQFIEFTEAVDEKTLAA